MEPTTLLPVISLLLLISVEFGGWSLLGFLTGRGQLGEFREQFFRAGHAHAGVLLVLSLVYFLYLPRAEYSNGVGDARHRFGHPALGGRHRSNLRRRRQYVPRQSPTPERRNHRCCVVAAR